MKPIIGVIMDFAEEGSFSKRPHYALRDSYFNMIYEAGGLPFAIPYIDEALEEYLQEISGLLVPGGDYALKKKWYINPDDEKPYPPSRRLEFDILMINKALQIDMPVLGICAGMQIMGGLLGAKLTSNIKEHFDTKMNHLNQFPADQLAHEVFVEEDSMLYNIVKRDKFEVNSAHTEAIISVPGDVRTSAVAPDGVIEAIEVRDHIFAVGLQWHPEFFIKKKNPSFMIVEEFISQAARVE